MQYNHYPSAQQVHPPSHPSPSPDEYSSPYPDASHHHSAVSYAAVNQATHMPAGSIGHSNITAQYPYSPYATQSPAADHRSYYSSSPQGTTIEHYPSPGSPTSSYATPNHSGPLSGQAPRHPAHLSHHSQQQFIPTPSQAYQVYSSPGSTASPRSRSTVEPYYHMSPNPQHAVHAPVASGAHGRSSSSSGSSHSQPAHGHHTSTIVVAAGERYPCDLCDRSFTRLHDRRRHYETVHATSPVLHKCRYCRKDFSRADSLKRHVDNGCDEMPR